MVGFVRAEYPQRLGVLMPRRTLRIPSVCFSILNCLVPDNVERSLLKQPTFIADLGFEIKIGLIGVKRDLEHLCGVVYECSDFCNLALDYYLRNCCLFKLGISRLLT